MITQEPKLAAHWDPATYHRFRARLSAFRHAEDDALLDKLFAAAQLSPTAREALAWAEAHGVRFVVDRTAEGVSGYYQAGTGVVALCAKRLRGSKAEAVDTLVHEIRHAWQDYHLQQQDVRAKDFASYLTTDALVEADARAYGRRAGDEYAAARNGRGFRKWLAALAETYMPQEYSMSLPSRPEGLAEGFLSWFKGKDDPAFYGSQALDVYARRLKVEAPRTFSPEIKYEFSARVKVPSSLLSDTGAAGLRKLGEDFNGRGNYLKALGPDILPRRILSASLARAFWGAATAEQQEVLTKLRKEDIRRRLAQPKRRHPWP